LTGIKPYSYDANELMDMVLRQPDNSYFKGVDTPNRYNFYGIGIGIGIGIGSSAFGDLGRGEASVDGDYFAGFTDGKVMSALNYLGLVGLHETIHLAGGAASARNGSGAYYNDKVLARAAQILTGAPNFPQSGSSNGFFSNQLREYCTP
jgi:hypothetical protein